MKISYIVEWDVYQPSGVLQKVDHQVANWCRMGHDVQLISVCPPENKESRIPFAQVIGVKVSKIFPRGKIRNHINKILSSFKVRSRVKSFGPDVIYFRQNTFYLGLEQILKLAPAIQEINTDDLREILHYTFFKRLIWRLGRGRILSHTAGFVCVTEELESRYRQYGKASVTISNGIDLSSLAPDDRGDTLNSEVTKLVFVGTPNLTWHGVDKVLKIAELIPEYEFHMIGPEKVLGGSGNVKWHGYLPQAEIHSMYREMDIAIGSLALHRYGLDEACTLKVREYAAFGLPMILGHRDTDLEGEEFVLNIGNYEENHIQNIEPMRSFVEKWKGRRINRNLVFGKIDTSVKEVKRLAFFQKLIEA